MSHYEHHDATASSRRRRRFIAGAAGMAVLLGGGAYAVTRAVTVKQDIIANRSGAQAPLAEPTDLVDPSPSASETGEAPVPSATATRDATPSATATTPAKSPEDEVREARKRAAKDGVALQRPLVTGPITAADVSVTNTGSLSKEGTTLRVISARGNLSGQRELAWVADRGRSYANARCSQKVKFSNESKGVVKPTLLICWRVSATRSVITVMVNKDARPSMADSVAALDRRWNELA